MINIDLSHVFSVLTSSILLALVKMLFDIEKRITKIEKDIEYLKKIEKIEK